MATEPLPAAAHPEHLTAALRTSGALGDGCVREVVVESARQTIVSRIIRLCLAYEGTAAGGPRSVILKTGLPRGGAGDAWNSGRQEVAFYAEVAAGMSARLVPRCFEARWSEATNAWHLLLEDLTESHVTPTMWPLPPTTEQCERILQAWARFHAAWWDDPRLGAPIGTWADAAAVDQLLQGFATTFERFADRLGDRLPRERRALYERFLGAAPRLFAGYLSHRNVTIVHGDAHVWNTFIPRDGVSDDVRIFDWDGWRLGVAAGDVAYMMAMHWYPDRRGRMERPLLDHYHGALEALGVRGYDRRALADDYRRSALWLITRPVWQAEYDIPAVIWWNNLERILLAVDDLGCRELLD